MKAAPAILLSLLAAGCGVAQTTEGLITGRVVDSITGRPVKGADVSCLHAGLGQGGSAVTGVEGRYALLFLPPGVYRLRVAAGSYQAQELHELTLQVAARIDITFRLRPLSDVWESGMHRSVFLPNSQAVLPFYGPDVDTSRTGSFEAARGVYGAPEPTLSEVIDPAEIRELPLAGRDVYTMLVAQPGVTADAGTARGLGLSVNGQRPSASNFLLDGIENNNYLVTGPLSAPAPEATQEYRVSTANFSAEYGRTSGYLANAVTRAGGSEWHGVAYSNLKNELLNAASFQENASGAGRSPYKEWQGGFQLGGPLWRRSWFISGALDALSSRSRAESQEYLLPTTEFVHYTAQGSISRSLIERFQPPPVTDGLMPVAIASIAPPVNLNRFLNLLRADRSAGRHRQMMRLATVGLSRPDFIWTPYKDFVSGLTQRSYSLMFGQTSTLRHNLGNDLRFGWSNDRIEWDRAHPEIPTLGAFDATVLPGSPAFYAFRNRGRGVEFSDGLTWNRGRHLFKLGGGFLLRKLDGYLTAGRDGRYLFLDFLDFAIDRPLFFSAPLARRELPVYRLPVFDREYGFEQYHFFAQDTYRPGPRWTIHLGLRWESFGSPRNTGPEKDGTVDLAAGQVVFPSGGEQRIYRSGGVFAPRFGFAFSPRTSARTVLRGAYGLFYDRPFDNLWLNVRNNNFVLPNFVAVEGNYLRPIAEVLPKYQGQKFAGDFPQTTLFDDNLKNGYSQSAFLGVERRWSDGWRSQVNGVAALGRRLITTDVWNRGDSNQAAGLPLVSYRGAQGLSDYYGLSVGAGYRGQNAVFEAAYTWSHSIDVQSEPLAGDFFDLSFVQAGATQSRQGMAAFTRQGDPRGDRSSSDFDQRHNLVLHVSWQLPRVWQDHRAGILWRDWRVSTLAAFRSGFPYSVYAPSTGALLNNRADLSGDPYMDTPVPGGRRLLNPASFRAPPAWRTGNTGRNAFRGPGLYNIDFSLSRILPLRALGEAGRLVLRADAYNLLNHANLNSPENLHGSSDFGVALYGRVGRDTGFPALIPFRESPRNVQILLRVEF